MKELVHDVLSFMIGILIIILVVGIPFLTGFMLLVLFWNFFVG